MALARAKKVPACPEKGGTDDDLLCCLHLTVEIVTMFTMLALVRMHFEQ